MLQLFLKTGGKEEESRFSTHHKTEEISVNWLTIRNKSCYNQSKAYNTHQTEF